MRLTESRFRRIIKEEVQRIIEAASGSTSKIEIGKGIIVLLSEWAKKHISTHGKPGVGSVFAEGDFISKITEEISKLEVSGGGGVYTVDVPGIGYDLVLPYDKASKLPDHEEVNVEKSEGRSTVTVKGFKTSAPIKDFITSTLSVVIRPTTNLQFVPEDVQQDPAVKEAMEAGKLYSVLSAWPGRDDVPPASKWGNDWAVVIPDAKSKKEAAFHKGSLLIERWQRLAGIK
jgi:hypothetical protein